MFKSVIAVTAVSLSVLAASAQAYTIKSIEKVSGVVSAVNADENTLSVTTANGQEKTFSLAESAKIILDNGTKYSLGAIEVGNKVLLKRQVLTQSSTELKGSLVDVDVQSRVITVREEESKDLVAVELHPNTVVKGTKENSLNALKQGQEIVLRRSSL